MEGKGLVLGYIDAWIVFSSLYAVGCAFGQDDDGIAQAGDAWPLVFIVLEDGGDVHIAEGHRGAVGNADVGEGTACAGECVTVMQQQLSGYRPQPNPFCIERHGVAGGLGQVAHPLPVAINLWPIGRGGPSYKQVILAAEAVGGEALCHVVRETLVVHRACAAIGVEGDGVGEVGDPFRVERHSVAGGLSQVAHALCVVIHLWSVGRGSPSFELVVCADETVGGEVLCHVVRETLVVHRACAAIGVEGDGVGEVGDPFRVECHGSARGGGQVTHTLLVIIHLRSGGRGGPSFKLVIGAGKDVHKKVLCHVVHETLAAHRVCAAIGIEGNGVGKGDKGTLSDEACLYATDGDGLAGATIRPRTDGVVAVGAHCGVDEGHSIINGDVPAIGMV